VPRPQSDIDTRIVEAARKRFLLEGVDGASLRSIARDAGTNIGMVYYYFKTKDELFLAVIETAYSGLLVDFSAALASDLTAEQRLARLFERIARLDEREFEVIRLVMREALVSSARLSKLATRFEQGHIPLLLHTLQDGIQAGDFDAQLPLPALLVATVALGFLPQVAHRLVHQAGLPIAPLLPTREQTARVLGDVLLHGIAAGSRRRSQSEE
jgi:TetR/AcrR family transcriptional regulator